MCNSVDTRYLVSFDGSFSAEEQRQRFFGALELTEKYRQFSSADVKERGFWKDYMRAYEEAFNETSRPGTQSRRITKILCAWPWLRQLWPALNQSSCAIRMRPKMDRSRFGEMRALLEGETDIKP